MSENNGGQPQPPPSSAAAGGGESSMPTREKRSYGNKLWVPIVILIGIIVGTLSYLVARSAENFPRFDRFGRFFGPDIYLEFHIILSTVGIALLVALIVVYAKTYTQTRANFIFGLLVVLFALLLQAILTYPLILEFEFATGFAILVFSPIADVFTILAYAVFLYLSLE